MALSSKGLFLLLLVNGIALSLDMVLWVRAVKKMKGFEWFVSQALYPLSVAMALWPGVLCLSWTGKLSSRDLEFPRRYLVLLALMGTTMNWGMAVGGAVLSGTLQTTLGEPQP